MNALKSDTFLVREEPIRRLERVVFALVETAKRSGEGTDSRLGAMRTALSGGCVECGQQVSGEELLALADLSVGKEAGARVLRLRHGRCARDGCQSDRYRLTLLTHRDLSWEKLLAQGDAVKEAQVEETADAGNREAEPAARHRVSRATIVRASILVAIGLLLLLIRQCYLGGRIPLIREPEQFRVDPAPPGQHLYR